MERLAKALLILYPDKNVIEEAKALAEAAGYRPEFILTQRYLSRSKFGIGSGKAEEASKIVKEKGIEAIIFDTKLNASQMYNLAKLCKVEVKDREKLILEIFAKRASSAEAKLQVQLAELNYELPKAKERVRMAKMGEQPGFFGLGKYEADVYAMMIKRRLAVLRKKLEEVRMRRLIFREHRNKIGLPTLAITGYTGAGKTTLFNRLSGESKDVDSGVFTTLSPTTRGIIINKRKLLISDTVGFISRLPTYMIEAFKSTLEEVSYSNLVLLLLDASQPEDKLVENYSVCIDTLKELSVNEDRMIIAMNKIDLVGDEELKEKISRLSLDNAVAISAKTGHGIDELLELISSKIEAKDYGV